MSASDSLAAIEHHLDRCFVFLNIPFATFDPNFKLRNDVTGRVAKNRRQWRRIIQHRDVVFDRSLPFGAGEQSGGTGSVCLDCLDARIARAANAKRKAGLGQGFLAGIEIGRYQLRDLRFFAK